MSRTGGAAEAGNGPLLRPSLAPPVPRRFPVVAEEIPGLQPVQREKRVRGAKYLGTTYRPPEYQQRFEALLRIGGFIAPTARRGCTAAGPRTPSFRWWQRSARPTARSQWPGPRNVEAGTAASRLATEGPGCHLPTAESGSAAHRESTAGPEIYVPGCGNRRPRFPPRLAVDRPRLRAAASRGFPRRA
jgi:hypothetical protein